MKVAFLGLGVMGAPMARHLAKAGHTVTVYNRTYSKAAAWVASDGGGAARTASARPGSRCQPGSSSMASAMRRSASRSEVEGSARTRSSQAAKPGTGERVTKVRTSGSSAFSSSTTCLMRKLPKETPARPRWVFEIE